MKTIELRGPVGDEQFNIRLLQDLPPGPLKIIIDSPGGCIVSGLAIFQALRDHDGEVITEVLHSGSAAVAVALAGQKRLIHGNGWFYVHECWGATVGRAGDMRESARLMQAQNRLSAGLISERTGLSLRRVQRLARNETTLDARQALKLNFATGIIGEAQPIERSFNAAKTGLAMIKHMERMQEPEPCRLFDEARSLAMLVPGAAAVLIQPAKPLPKIAPEKSGEALDAFVENQRREAEVRRGLSQRLRRAIQHGGIIQWPIRVDWKCSVCGETNYGPPAQNRLATPCAFCAQTSLEETP